MAPPRAGKDLALPRRATRELLAEQSRILERAAAGVALEELLADLCALIEEPAKGTRCTALLVEDGVVRHACASDMPESYTSLIEGQEIGPDRGSCGTAAHFGVPVLVDDIATDPKWEPWREAALSHGLRACWSLPVMDRSGAVVATFAAYSDTPRLPTSDEYELLAMAAHLASVLVSQDQARTGLAAMAARLEAANEELRRANRAKDDFLSLTSHELRTPLTPMSGMLETLRARWEELDDVTRRSLIEVVAHHTERLGLLVDDLLTMAVVSAGQLRALPEQVDVAEAVRDAVTGMFVQDREVEVAVPAGLSVRVDPRHLQQILLNYLSNALKYAPQGTIRVDAVSDGGEVRIRCEDEGAGIAEELLPRLFDVFSQGDTGDRRTVQGTGLGLAVVRELAHVNHGRAWYEPSEDRGARFVVALPAA